MRQLMLAVWMGAVLFYKQLHACDSRRLTVRMHGRQADRQYFFGNCLSLLELLCF